jgi:hypothetical protein
VGLLSRRLLRVCFHHLAFLRRISKSIRAQHLAMAVHALMAILRRWKGRVSSEKRRRGFLLSCAACSIRDIFEASVHIGFRGAPSKSVVGAPSAGKRSTEFRRRAIRFGVCCIALKLAKAEFFALWASKAADTEIFVPVGMQDSGGLQGLAARSEDATSAQIIVWKIREWLALVLRRRLHAVTFYYFLFYVTKQRAFRAWFLLLHESQGFDVIRRKIAQFVVLNARKKSFSGWAELFACPRSEWSNWQGMKTKRRFYSLWLSARDHSTATCDQFARSSTRTYIGSTVTSEWSTDYSETSNASSRVSSLCSSPMRSVSSPTRFNPTLSRLASQDSKDAVGMTGVTGGKATLDMQDALASGLDVDELRMDLQAAHMESKAANEAAQVSIVIATLSQHILSKLQINFVYWKKRTILSIARKKRDKRRIKSMQKKRQCLQVRVCNIWFRAHRILKDRVADVVDQVVHYNLKHEFLFLWRESHEGMQELVGIYARIEILFIIACIKIEYLPNYSCVGSVSC